MKMEFWFEFASTYSYPVAMKIADVARDYGIELIWKPFLLGPIFKAQGWNDSPFNVYPAKGNYMWRDMERICADQGIPFTKPSVFPRNGLLAARVSCRFNNEIWLPQFVRDLYCANFEKDLDISKKEVVMACLPFSATESAAIIEEAVSDRAKASLKENTDTAIGLGIFGAPSFVVDQELFWGGDRLMSAVEWATRAKL